MKNSKKTTKGRINCINVKKIFILLPMYNTMKYILYFCIILTLFIS